VDGMIALVDALEARDRYTCGHSARVAVVAGRLAQRIIGRAAECAEIQLAARLHDIGKVAVPDSLLDKPSSLTEAEVEVMDTHPIAAKASSGPLSNCAAWPVSFAAITNGGMERGIPTGLREHGFPSVRASWPSRIRGTR